MKAYLCGRNSPYFIVIWSHEDISNSFTTIAQNPFFKVLRLCICNTTFHSSVNHSLHTPDLVVLGEHGDIILERVRYP
jgi:hypothetical protein